MITTTKKMNRILNLKFPSEPITSYKDTHEFVKIYACIRIFFFAMTKIYLENSF